MLSNGGSEGSRLRQRSVRAIGEVELVDLVEVAFAHRVGDARGIEALHAAELESLARSHVEPSLAAVPVAREHHRLALRDVERAVRLQCRVDLQVAPVQAALGLQWRRDQQREKRESQLHALNL